MQNSQLKMQKRTALFASCILHYTRSAGPTRFDLLERFLDETLVVFLGDVAFEQLRRDRDREIHGFVADLLQRALGLHLNLTLGVLDDAGGLRLRLLLQLVAKPGGV